MGEVQSRLRFRTSFVATSKDLGGSSVEQHLERMEQVCIKLVEPSHIFMS